MRHPKVALINRVTGVTGQGGDYLNELLQKGNEVHGIKCRLTMFNADRIDRFK